MRKTFDQKLDRIRKGTDSTKDFIIADAKDADMAFGIAAPGELRDAHCPHGFDESQKCFKTLADYRDQIRAVIRQQVVDIVLMSASTLEVLGIDEQLFRNSPVTPAARANDTTDVWAVRGGRYIQQPARHFRTATLDHIQHGRVAPRPGKEVTGADLGLYSVTFTNDLDTDYQALEAFHDFRIEAEKKRFRYFLEVFNPNIDAGLEPRQVGNYINDCIVRCLAGVTRAGRPEFLKIPYNGPGPLEELAAYDSSLVVGVLGGSSGTTRDAFQLIHDARKHGAKVALFGRKINHAESQLDFIRYLRAIADGDIGPEEAVKAYHHDLGALKIRPIRSLEEDQRLTEASLSYG